VAGLEQATRGAIRIGDDVVNDRSPRERDVAMVFQNYALYPHKTIFDNLAFSLKIRRTPKSETKQRVDRVATLLRLEEYLGRRPAQLSGGQKQRVATGRAIVREPRVFLMDEPLSNLDAKLRTQMRSEIKGLQARLGVTTIYVTHDQIEAMTMGDRVAVMQRGRLLQFATPQTIYEEPASVFVAGFIGSPPMNFLEGRLAEVDGRPAAMLRDLVIPLDDRELRRMQSVTQHFDQKVVVGIRPESLSLNGNDGEHSSRRIVGKLLLQEALGPEIIAHVEVDADPAVTEETRDLALDVDEAVLDALVAPEQRATLQARLFGQHSFGQDDAISLGIGPGALYFFRPDDGARIV